MGGVQGTYCYAHNMAGMLVNICDVVFKWIIAQVLLTRLKIKLKILLCFTIQEPEISHLHCTGTLLLDRVIDDA